ncbi:MAG: PKD domain-containing protein [Halobacteriales archaeon]|nr:PKD domain-containing protein [Halobacteriales archaeon]
MPRLLRALLLVALAACALALAGHGEAAAGLEAPALLQDHDPIRIDSDFDFDAAHGVTGGNGTAGDPYLIANWRIASDGVHVRVANTTKAFVLRNLELIGQCVPQNISDCGTEAGVYAQKARSPEVVHVLARGMDRAGIYMDQSPGAELVENAIEGGGNFSGGTGILVKGSNGALVRGNVLTGVGPAGSNLASAAVRIWDSNDTLLQDNEVRGATEAGVSVLGSHRTELVDNDIVGNRVGVTFQGYEGLVWYNNITDSTTYGLVLTLPWAHIEHNEITDNTRGIEITDVANASISRNNIQRNAEIGLHLQGNPGRDESPFANATQNYWGAGDGPGGIGPGNGDRIGVNLTDPGQVLFRPFLTGRLDATGRHAPRPFSTLVVGSGVGEGGPGATQHTPSAMFEGPGDAFLGQPVTWSAARSVDPQGGSLRYAWDLGDGNASAGLRVTHVYASEGERIVTLTVTDQEGLSKSASVRVSVTRQPLGVFLLLTSREVPRGAPIALRALVTGTPLDNVTFRWALDGPGSFDRETGADILQGRFDEPGVRIVGVMALAGGEVATAFDQVRVRNGAPNASANVQPAEGDTRTDFAFDASGSADPDHDNLTLTWDWGDGGTGQGPHATHRFASAGTQVVVLTVSDGFATNTTQAVVQVRAAEQPVEKPTPGPAPLLAIAALALGAWKHRGSRRR